MERLLKDYFRDGEKREALNALTRSVFGFDFTDWYGGGYYTGEYIPYSIEMDGRIVSNASANIMRFALTDGDGGAAERNYIQIGTVMTAPEYRRRGLAGKLVREIIRDYREKCDGIYLFGNLSALDFYRELGFWTGRQYKVSLKKDTVIEKRNPDFRPVRGDREKRERYLLAVRGDARSGAFEQVNRFGLQMFYTGGFENVYYSERLDCFACYTCGGGALRLDSIVADREVPVAEVLSAVPDRFERAVVGFTPREGELALFDREEDEDAGLLYMGDALREIEEKKLYFPEYSHA